VNSKRQRKIPWFRKVLYALLPTVAMLVGLELGLKWIGIEPVLHSRDPFVGFSTLIPLFQADTAPDGSTRMVTAPSKLVWFNAQTFSAQKAAGTRRVFCVGGSTTFGRPYDDATSYSGWLRAILAKLDVESQWEVINAGGVSYASYRVANVMDELAAYEPDLFIVYSVHNEFLERRTYANRFDRPRLLSAIESQVSRLRTYAIIDRWVRRARIAASQEEQGSAAVEKLPAEVDERLNHTIGPTDYHRDPGWRLQVLEHYRFNLERMVRIAQRAGARIVFVTPASNESACSPFKSEMSAGLSSVDQEVFQAKLQVWQRADAEGDSIAALAAIESALEIDPLHAEARYRLGCTLSKLGHLDAAHRAFVAALDQDICPLRAVSEVSQILRDVAAANRVPLVDFELLLHEKSQRELGTPSLGEAYFLDHVHPTMEIHRQLAIWIMDCLQREQIVGGRSILTADAQPMLEAIQVEITSRIDNEVHGIALRNLAKVLHWSGKYDEAAPRASDALELLPHDLESRYVLADCLANTGETRAALEQYQILFQDGDFPRAYLPFADILLAEANYQAARDYALLAMLSKPDNAYAYFLLGKAHYALEEYGFAVEALEKTLALSPGNPPTIELLEMARKQMEPK
jgi:tetratricopeptide (TPR) repeat protein